MKNAIRFTRSGPQKISGSDRDLSARKSVPGPVCSVARPALHPGLLTRCQQSRRFGALAAADCAPHGGPSRHRPATGRPAVLRRDRGAGPTAPTSAHTAYNAVGGQDARRCEILGVSGNTVVACGNEAVRNSRTRVGDDLPCTPPPYGSDVHVAAVQADAT